jgi:outer membrane protein assembly factor BamB
MIIIFLLVLGKHTREYLLIQVTVKTVAIINCINASTGNLVWETRVDSIAALMDDYTNSPFALL